MSGLSRWSHRHPRRVDGLLAAVVLAAAVWGPAADRGRGPGHRGEGALDVLAVVLLAGAAGSLVLRRSHPLPVWWVSLLVAFAVVLHTGAALPAAVLSVVALYTVGVLAPLRTTVHATLVTTAVYAVTVTAVDGVFGDRTVTLLAFLGAAAAVGVAVRSQRSAVVAAEARARQAEVTREEEAERRVTDERLRIARELHDVVAHHISVVNVQAGVARHLLVSDPDQARTALGLVREASRTVLSEMSTVLGLLRTGEDENPVEPIPGLEQVPSLVDTVGRAGLRTTCRTAGQPRHLSELAELAAYRVVQESLTNALKHGAGTAELELSYEPSGVVVEVRNPLRDGAGGPSEGGRGGGLGLVGMRERVASVGGRLTAGEAPGGCFAVRAEIPGEAA